MQFDTNSPTQTAANEIQIKYNTIHSCLSNLNELCDKIQLIDAETDLGPEERSI